MSDGKDGTKLIDGAKTNVFHQLFPSSCSILICVAIIAMLFVNNYPNEGIVEPIVGSLFMPFLVCTLTSASCVSVFVNKFKDVMQFKRVYDYIEMDTPLLRIASPFTKMFVKPFLDFLEKFSIGATATALLTTLLVFSNLIAMFNANAKNSLILSCIPLLFCLCTASCIGSIGPVPPSRPPSASPPRPPSRPPSRPPPRPPPRPPSVSPPRPPSVSPPRPPSVSPPRPT